MAHLIDTRPYPWVVAPCDICFWYPVFNPLVDTFIRSVALPILSGFWCRSQSFLLALGGGSPCSKLLSPSLVASDLALSNSSLLLVALHVLNCFLWCYWSLLPTLSGSPRPQWLPMSLLVAHPCSRWLSLPSVASYDTLGGSPCPQWLLMTLSVAPPYSQWLSHSKWFSLSLVAFSVATLDVVFMLLSPLTPSMMLYPWCCGVSPF